EHDGIPAMREVTIDLTLDEPLPPPRHPQRPPQEPPFAYDLHPGDTIYMDGRPFNVDEVRFFDVTFRDPEMVYPIFRAESKSILGPLLDRDERNLPFRTAPLEQAQTEEGQETELPPVQETASEPAVNFRITDNHLGEGGQKTKFENNMRAIRTLKTLEKENRPASPEDQEVLSQYVGWGGIPQAFDERNAAWADEYRELKYTLTPEEYEMARASTLNAHYTSPTVIRAIYSAVEQMGFRTGNILEPSCGVGNFFGLLPETMQNSRLYGVELDSITGRIAQYLYPQADIAVTGFEKTDRKDFFDLAIGNVPFGAYKVADRQFDRYNFLIHDYFFAKALDQVRPGGIVAFITSKGTMDKQSPEVRKYIAQRAELLGAIRLPNNAFKANAGTEVTSDIIFLQKRDRAIDIEPDWVHLGQTEDGVPVNSYFADHPDMILGKMVWDDSMYGAHQETACQALEGADLSQQLAEAVTKISGTYRAEEAPELSEGEAIRDSIPADPNVRNYSYTVVDDKVYYRENSAMVHPDLNATAEARIKGMVGLRDCVHRLMEAQLQESDDFTIHELQAELNTLYDSFTARFGLINSRPNAQAFSDDSSYYLLSSLEILTENGELERKADMFTKRTIRQQRTVEHVDTSVEALAVSIAEKAAVDLPFMAELTGKSEDEIASELTGVIFRLPAPVDENGSPRYVTADEYLSGNVRQKLRDARAAAGISPIFEANVSALEKAQPKDLDASEIDVRLGATWVDKKYIQQFMEELFEIPFYQRRAVQVQYSNFTSEWRINGKNVLSYNNVPNNLTYGT
ncbi:MAG: N-6 DNA methylase, partial [Clostridia bacterium]|nr:N-6 DNA methylase [Clostridia bacterium]